MLRAKEALPSLQALLSRQTRPAQEALRSRRALPGQKPPREQGTGQEAYPDQGEHPGPQTSLSHETPTGRASPGGAARRDRQKPQTQPATPKRQAPQVPRPLPDQQTHQDQDEYQSQQPSHDQPPDQNQQPDRNQPPGQDQPPGQEQLTRRGQLAS
jgi:hypothetical protein